MATSYLNLLETHLQDWRELLIVWATNGTLSRAAQTALQLEGEPEKLRELVGEWSQGDFRNLPPVVLLPAGDMPGAAGAYAISTRTIYLNQDWLQSANREQALAVLTEELGHHLDGLLNASDTPGDEGELFSDLLTGRLPPLQDKAGYFVEDDSAAITLNTQEQDIEMSAFLPISLPIQRDLEIEVFDPDAIGPDRITLIRIAVLINGVSSGLSDFSAFGKFLNTLYEYKDLIGLFYDLQKTIQQDKSDWELAASREKFIKDLVSISVGASMGFFGPPGILAGLAFGILVDYGITKPLVESITAPLQLFEGYYGKIPVTEALLDGKFDAYPAISELAARYISGGDTGLTRDQFNQLLQEQGQYETFLTIISANSNGGTSGLPQYGAGESSMYLSIDGKLSLKPGSGNIVEDVSQFAMYELILEGASIKGSLANELTYYYGTIIDLSIELTGIVNIDTRSSTQFLGATNNRGIVNLINGSTFVISQGSFSNTGILDSRSGNVDFWIDVSEHGVIKTDENAGGLVRFRGGIHTFNSAAKFTGKNFLADYDATITGVWSNELTFASGTIKNLEISADGIINIDLSASNVSSATLLGVLNNKGTVNLLRSSVPYSGGYGLVFGDERGKVDFSNSGIFNSGDSNGYEVSLATLQEAGSTFNNSGVFNVKSNTYVGLDFVNTGTIANTLGYTLVISQGSFSNTGILDSRSGNVDFWIDVSEHGVIKTDENAGGLVRFRGGIHTFNSAAKFTGKNFLADYDATITGVWSNELTFASGTIKNLEISADGIINIDLSASNVSSATLLGVLNNKGTVNLLRSSVPYSGGYGLVFGDERGKVDFSNSGIFNSGDSNGYEVSLATLQEAGSTFNNSGVFNVKSNTYVGLDFVNTGTIANSFGSTLWFTSQLVNHGIFDSRSASVHFYSDYLQSAGKTIIQEDTLLTLASGTQFLLDGGLLTGNGTINGSIRNSSIINPGVSIGSLVISGNFLQTGTGMTNIEIGGTSNFDSLQISGEASLDGLINILLVNGFVPKLDDSFKIANFTSISAVSLSFSGLRINDALSFQSDVLADGIYLTVVSSSLPKFADISSVTDNVGLIQGVVAAGARTDDTTPTITGTISAALAAGETLRIYNGSTLLGSATVNNTAKTWTYTPTLPATAGTTYNITAQVA
ncbi:hypothetical protein KBZ33_20280, partial [Cyanobium sp. Cruz-8D1]|nr:hypothetical protein [Cyanobium sp. Cruz-8H5]MCP9868592.1 hypothetical protein [Cyanobium sp. Cruz-8D1]